MQHSLTITWPFQQSSPVIWRSRPQVVALTVMQNGINISADQCTAHLKLLEAFNQLREDIGQTENLFGIESPTFNESENPDPRQHAQSPQALAKIRVAEKRWAVYVARAVDRFERWYDACVPATMGGAPCEKLTGNQICTKKGLDKVAYHGIPIKQLTLENQLPPLDVLMVWHSYMLNPRCFFEDCFRYGEFHSPALQSIHHFMDPGPND
jgi:hypothetical protein